MHCVTTPQALMCVFAMLGGLEMGLHVLVRSNAMHRRVLTLLLLDTDECALGTATCSANGTCYNQVGTYSCACKQGYHKAHNNIIKHPHKTTLLLLH
jgi:hypothetical protein